MHASCRSRCKVNIPSDFPAFFQILGRDIFDNTVTTFDKIINDDCSDFNNESSINTKDSFDNKFDNLMEEYENLNCIMNRLEKIWKECQFSKTLNENSNESDANYVSIMFIELQLNLKF